MIDYKAEVTINVPSDWVNYPPWAEILSQAPRAAGVYMFKDVGGRVLDVGKAVNPSGTAWPPTSRPRKSMTPRPP